MSIKFDVSLLLIAVVAVLVSSGAAHSIKLDVMSTSDRKAESEGRLLSDSSIEIALTTLDDLHYTTSLGFGKDSSGTINELPVLVDTRSPWVWVQSTESQTTSLSPTAKLNTADVSSLHENGLSQTFTYLQGTATAAMAYVDIYISAKTEVQSQIILIGSEFENFPEITTVAGVLGLGTLYAAKGNETLLDSLYESKMITSNAFTLSLNSSNGKGSLILGEVSDEGIAKGSKFKEYDLIQSYPHDTYHTFSIASFSFGSYASVEDTYATIDSGNPFIGIPELVWWQAVINEIPSDQCIGQGTPKAILCKCGSFTGFPNLEFDFEGMAWTFEPQNYMVKTNLSKEYPCQLGVVPNYNGFDRLSLGSLFLKNVVVAIDNDNYKLSIAANNQSKIKPIIKDSNSAEVTTLTLAIPLFVSLFMMLMPQTLLECLKGHVRNFKNFVL